MLGIKKLAKKPRQMTMLTFIFVITVILAHHLDAKGMFNTLILLQVWSARESGLNL